jgi:hypothetical protein
MLCKPPTQRQIAASSLFPILRPLQSVRIDLVLLLLLLLLLLVLLHEHDG